MLRTATGLMLLCASEAALGQAYTLDPYGDALVAAPAIITSPETGERRVITPGEPVIDQRNGRWSEGAILDGPVTSPPKVANAFAAPTGGEFYQISSKAALKACGVELGAEGAPPCLLDDDGDGQFDRVSSNYIRKAYPLARPVPYHRGNILLPPATPGLTRRLLYQGMAAGELKLSYREFTNDLARPAFEESLSVPLSAEFPQKVAAKGATLTIYKIDGLGMDYQVDEPGSFAAPL